MGSSELTQLTDRPTGTSAGTISADGRWVHYVEDTGGDELGHWMRVPIEGGEPVDLTPDMPAYASYDLRTTGDGRLMAFTAVVDDNHTMYVMPDPAGGQAAPPRRAVPDALQRSTPLVGTVPAACSQLPRANEPDSARFSIVVL